MSDSRNRVQSVDLLRGVVMVLMALDHVRDYFSETAFAFDPTDLTRTTPLLFFTRWVTHFCAPVFVFLAGTGAYLSLGRGRSKGELSRFLLTRGLFLIVLDPTVIRHSWIWDGQWHFAFGQVIWVIGWSMVLLSLLVHLPRWCSVAFGLILVCGHNYLDHVQVESTSVWGKIWILLHVQNIIEPIAGFQFFVLYPLVPWVGVMALGYAFGPILTRDPEPRRRGLWILGLSLIVAFVALRWINVSGDPHPWSVQKNNLFTLLSFIRCEKYPPSLLFLLMTLGPAIVALTLFDRASGAWMRPIVLFGRVPMFYYLIHVPFIHVIAGFAQMHKFGWHSFTISPLQPPAGFGFPLAVVYGVWIAVVVALYFPCRWFAAVKARRKDWWLSYL